MPHHIGRERQHALGLGEAADPRAIRLERRLASADPFHQHARLRREVSGVRMRLCEWEWWPRRVAILRHASGAYLVAVEPERAQQPLALARIERIEPLPSGRPS